MRGKGCWATGERCILNSDPQNYWEVRRLCEGASRDWSSLPSLSDPALVHSGLWSGQHSFLGQENHPKGPVREEAEGTGLPPPGSCITLSLVYLPFPPSRTLPKVSGIPYASCGLRAFAYTVPSACRALTSPITTTTSTMASFTLFL